MARGGDFSNMAALTMSEKRVVNAYLTHAYGVVNRTLEGRANKYDDVASAKALANQIDRALRKIPTYQGETTRVMGFSGRKASQQMAEYLSQFKVGETVTFKGFLSTGTNTSKLKSKFKQDATAHFSITSKRGHDLRRYNPEEREVLFNRGTTFRVVSKRGNNIRLEEI